LDAQSIVRWAVTAAGWPPGPGLTAGQYSEIRICKLASCSNIILDAAIILSFFLACTDACKKTNVGLLHLVKQHVGVALGPVRQ